MAGRGEAHERQRKRAAVRVARSSLLRSRAVGVLGEDERRSERHGLLTIGAFSRATGLTLKTLRLYDERGLVPPTWVDEASGYRYYGERALEQARLVAGLRHLEFSLTEIGEMLGEIDGTIGLVPFLETQRERIAARQKHLARVNRVLDEMIRAEKQARASEAGADVVMKDAPPLLVATQRFRGRYDETGRAMGRLGRHFGRVASGPPLNLYHELEMREDDADIESCMPIREARRVPGFVVRTLEAVRVACLVHWGPYGEIGRSYARVIRSVEELGAEVVAPIREVYLKGPGLLFAGDPRNYRTELQIPLRD